MSRTMEEARYSRIVVIGDLHAHLEPCERLLAKISPRERDLIVFIGDYVDRGPDSRELVQALIDFGNRLPDTVFLRGNHEDMLLGSIGSPAVVRDFGTWLYNGGARTLASYGMGRLEMQRLGDVPDEEERRKRILDFIPASHIEFFEGLELYVETERFFVCHAGLNPLLSIEEGRRNVFDLLWTRDHIGYEDPVWEKTVVCGHTPQRRVLVSDRLICIDTGLYCYGTLSAIDLLSGDLFQVKGGEGGAPADEEDW